MTERYYTHDELQHMICRRASAANALPIIVTLDRRHLDKIADLLVVMTGANPRAERLFIGSPLLYHNNTMMIDGLQEVINLLEACDEEVKRLTGKRSALAESLNLILSKMENSCMTVQRCVLQGCETVHKELRGERVDGS